MCNVYPNRVTIQEDEGFLIRLSPNGIMPLQSCQLARNNKIYFFTPGQNKTHYLPNGEIVHPFDPNDTFECGIRVYGTNTKSEGEWRLTSIDEDGVEQSGSAAVSVQFRDYECPTTSPEVNAQCRITNLDTMVEVKDCSVKPNHYLCYFMSDGKITESVYYEKNLEKVRKSWKSPTITETGSVFECDCKEVPYVRITKCTIEHVTTGRKFNIQEGLLDTHYSAYKTDFHEKLCQFEIQQKVTEKDVGIWKMTLEFKNQNLYQRNNAEDTSKTCKFLLEGSTEASLKNLMDRTSSVITIKTIKDKERIECAKDVFYPITICYLTGDHIDKLLISNNYEEMEDGRCAFEVGPGNFTCGFNGPTQSDMDYMQQFEVIKHDSEVIDGVSKAVENGTTLECHHIGGRPIKLCGFLSPSGRFYRVASDTFNSAEYSYYKEDGGSMITGDCGIKFPADVEVESGNWLCVTDPSLSVKSTTWIEV